MSESAYRDRNKLEIFAWPELMEAFGRLAGIALGPGKISRQLKSEIFTVVSTASGCHHCQAHGAYGLHLNGTSLERIQALWTFEESPLFSGADRAALRLARDAGLVPNLVTAAHFEELRRHYSDEEIREFLAVIAISGFLNRYSDTLAVVTDQESADWAREYLSPVGWALGKHAGEDSEQRANFPSRGPLLAPAPGLGSRTL